MQAEEIKYLIEKGLLNAEVYVEGDGSHFTAIVICPLFVGKSRLEKQQMVYATVKQELLQGSLHALSLKTFTREEWQATQENRAS